MNSNMTPNVTDCWSFLGTIGTPVITWPECDRISLKWILKFHSKDYIHFSFLTKLFSYSQIKNSILDLSLTRLISKKWKKKIGYTFCWTRKKSFIHNEIFLHFDDILEYVCIEYIAFVCKYNCSRDIWMVFRLYEFEYDLSYDVSFSSISHRMDIRIIQDSV